MSKPEGEGETRKRPAARRGVVQLDRPCGSATSGDGVPAASAPNAKRASARRGHVPTQASQPRGDIAAPAHPPAAIAVDCVDEDPCSGELAAPSVPYSERASESAFHPSTARITECAARARPAGRAATSPYAAAAPHLGTAEPPEQHRGVSERVPESPPTMTHDADNVSTAGDARTGPNESRSRSEDQDVFVGTLHSDAPASFGVGSSMLSALTRRASAALRVRVEPVDEFGFDAAYEARLRPFFESVYRAYLRVDLVGAQHVPDRGRALLVANHSRALPWDGVMLRTALRLNHATQRQLRWLVEDDQFHAPFLGTLVSRLGAVRACQDNAERLLWREELLAVFPEGKAEKSYSQRYRLHRFGRGGYVKLALRTRTPVIPVAIVGQEEPRGMFDKGGVLSRWVGMPLSAIAPAMPRLGALGVLPVPSRWKIVIGEPIQEIARQDAEATREEGLIHELNECVRSAVQHLLDSALERV